MVRSSTDMLLRKTSLLLDFSEHHAMDPRTNRDFEVSKMSLKTAEESIDKIMDRRLTSSQRETLRSLTSQVTRIKKTLSRSGVSFGNSPLFGLGLRTKTLPRKIIETVTVERAALAMRELYPKIRLLYLVGSRLRRKVGRDLEFVAVVERLEDMPGRNIIGLKFGKLTVDLFFSLPEETETHILEYGLGADNIRWKKVAKSKGYKLNRYGLWKGSVKVSSRMAEIAAILKLPLKPFLVATLENPL